MPPPIYWKRLREIADKYSVVLIADEVITGFGRTGTMFCMDRWGVKPDMTVVAKALTSGYSAARRGDYQSRDRGRLYRRR